jgi:predicted phosphohydrolase
VLLEQYGRRLLVQFGHAGVDDPNVMYWLWEQPLQPEDAVCVVGDLTFGMLGATKNTDGHIEQVRLAKVSLEAKVAGLATELRDLKDAPKKEG